MTRTVSMAMVAARAGVSGQTVSRVANGSSRVDPRTRARVEQAMADLGYRPNRAARALRTGRSHTLGLVVSTLGSVGNFRLVHAVSETAEARGYALMIVTATDSAATGAAFNRLVEEGVDGAIVVNEAAALATAQPDTVNAAARRGLRLVVIDAPPAQAWATVGSQHSDGAHEAVEYLTELGHQTVYHVAGPAESYAAAQREQGWRAALADADAPTPAVVRGDWSAESGYAAGSALFSRKGGRRDGHPVTAVFCANDQMALGVIRAATDAGLHVPHDVSVVGFDDVPEAANYRPPLTTVRQDFVALGEAAVRALTDPDAPWPPPLVSVATPLVVRDSTAGPPPALFR